MSDLVPLPISRNIVGVFLSHQYVSKWNNHICLVVEMENYISKLKKILLVLNIWMLSKYKNARLPIINFWQKNAISQWLAENGITEKFIMNICAQLVKFLGMSTSLLYARLMQISEVHIFVTLLYRQKPSMSKFIELMTCDRHNNISKLAVFIFETVTWTIRPYA